MEIVMRVQMSGTRDGVDWPPAGGIIEVPDTEAAELIALGLAKEATDEDRIEPAAEAEATAGPDAEGDAPAAEDAGSVDLEELTVAELRDLADERGVDLEGVTKKADIIAALTG